MASFVDRVVLHVAAGDGGHGVASVKPREVQAARRPRRRQRRPRRQRRACASTRRPRRCSTTTTTRTARPPTAQPGAGDERNGADGDDLVLPVPAGTVVKDAPTARSSPTSSRSGQTYVVARGGRGGLGNKALVLRPAQGARLRAARRARRRPRRRPRAEVAGRRRPDRLPVRRQVHARLGAVSAARPKIADYPFTTLVPNLGVVTAGEQRFTVADVPGLIPGRERGQGPGPGVPAPRRALLGAGARHRLRDPGARPRPDDRPRRHRARARAVRPRRHPRRPAALRAHPDRRAQQGRRARGARARRDGQARPGGPRPRGVHRLRRGPHRAARADASRWPATSPRPARSSRPPSRPQRIVLRPKAVDDSGFVVKRENTPDGEVFRIVGERPTRWVRQTDFSNDEAVGYLADRLARAGVEEALFKAGAVAGRHRRSSAAPTTPSSSTGSRPCPPAPSCSGPRGTDLRLDEPAPPDPRGEARGLRRPPRRPDRGARGARGRAPRRPLGRRGPGGRRGGAAAGGRLRTGRRLRPVRGRRRGRRSLTRLRPCPPATATPSPPPPARGQGRLELADHGARVRSTGRGCAPSSTCWPPSGAAAPRSCWSPPAPSRPASARWGWPAGPRDLATQQAAASVGQGALARGVQQAFGGPRPHGRAGAAHRRRRDPALALRQRPPHPGPAARPRGRPRRQRERHRGHARDPRSATTTGWPRWWPTSCTPTRCCCSPTSTRCTTGRPRRAGTSRVPLVRRPRRPRRRARSAAPARASARAA